MGTVTQILLIVPCVFSCITTVIYAYIAYQNFKKPRDEVWETATKICQSNGKYTDANEFAQIYEQLKFFKDHGCNLEGKHLLQAMQEASEQERR